MNYMGTDDDMPDKFNSWLEDQDIDTLMSYADDYAKECMRKAKENAHRLGFTDIEWKEMDFLDFKPDTPPDHILLDAPCSGLGVLRRHPEGNWLKTPDIIPAMAEKQKKLIM